MAHDDEGAHDDFYAQPAERPTLAETRAAAEIVLYLEDELGAAARRLYVRVKEGVVYVQGNVASHELRRRLEAELPKRPGISGAEFNLYVQENE
jgi:hypothetical protein